jgi:hypothetical protein
MAPPKLELTGKRFHQLVALRPAGKDRAGYVMWECRCDCGRLYTVKGAALVSGNTKSCGCRKTGPTSRFTPEELALKAVWKMMLYRCYDPTSSSYAYYGGIGITVCDEWRESLSVFTRDVGPRPSKRHTLDRIDGTKGYEPNNCRWATKSQQTDNRRNSIRVTVGGRVMSLTQAAKHDGIPYHVAKYRVDHDTYYPVLPRVVGKRTKKAA